MPTLALGSGCTGARVAVLACALLVGVTGCETVEVMEPPPPEPEVIEKDVETIIAPVDVEPPTGAMIVRTHAQSDTEMPEGATAKVTLRGAGGSHSAELPKGERLARFDALESGRYDLLVTVNSGGVEIGSYSYFVQVTETLGDVTIRIDYARADLVVEAGVETSLDRRYVGTASIDSDACPGVGPSGTFRSDLHMATDGGGLELTIVNFQRETLRLSGRIASGPAPSVAGGTFESSDGMSGNWQLTHLTAPTPAAVAAMFEFDNRTQSCRATLEYAGLVETGMAPAPLGSNEPLATVEVVGHGQTRTVSLSRDESVARFDGLLVGPYDIFVGVGHGDRMIDSHRESVMLTGAGARVETTFETEWALEPAGRLAAGANDEPLRHTFDGKSVVASGSPECMGSIPLVDTTKLTMAASGKALEITFDSFYGKVLELNGLAGEAQGLFTASGTYRSSDAKTGSWTINHLAMPTSRSLAMLVEFQNETDSCRATYEFSGVR